MVGKMKELKRGVVTGLGMITSLGNNVGETWDNLIAGKSGVSHVSLWTGDADGCDESDTSIAAGKVKDFNLRQTLIERKKAPGKEVFKQIKHMDVANQFALAASLEAINDAALSSEKDIEKAGVYIATGFGGISSWEEQHKKLIDDGINKISPFLIPKFLHNLSAGNVAIVCKAKGPNVSVSTACAAGAHSIGLALHSIQLNEADIIIAGGTEAPLTPLVHAGFRRMGALSSRYERNGEYSRASRPFDIERDGFVLGEGAGIMILEELDHALRRGARIYGEITGFGMTGDAEHITNPCLEGVVECMRLAIQRGGIEPDMVDYINPHATSTPVGDKNEAQALLRVFGTNNRRPFISATKASTAHTLGASGAIEAILAIKALETGIIPSTINLEHIDPECDGLNHVMNQAIRSPIRYAVSNSFGFGGTNASLVFKKWE
ncbi:MAG: beta-ketoacyl-[acyl-carrier-protein] synthase II [Thermodesulfobacteriota bacterium]|nr:beta-ketoacyl-[acyl-carrier-protein] synthase II [Thermodesulfobacteriota bacterium]